MAELPTLGVLACVDGRLMGDIGDVYEVISYLIGRPAFTHELPKYGRLAETTLAAAFPDMDGQTDKAWEHVRDGAILKHGKTVSVPDDLAGSLSDGVGVLQNLIDAISTPPRSPEADR